MIRIRAADARGQADLGWLQSRFSFSFADYHDPAFMGFRRLRVINEDWVQPDKGFGAHPHHDMEILTYVLSGRLEHKDSMGNGSIIGAADVQYMCAGKGVVHSEFNPSADEPVHLLQIWLQPELEGLEPEYQQVHVKREQKLNKLCLIAGAATTGAHLQIHQDTALYAGVLEAGFTLNIPTDAKRHQWLQVIQGGLQLNGTAMRSGDGAACTGESGLELKADSESELLLFDLA